MITLADQLAEARRESAVRRRCYPQWVKSGRLPREEAAYQLMCMEEIVKTLARLEVEQRQLALFGTHR